MKIAFIGSTQYKTEISKKAHELRQKGHEVILPAFDQIDDITENLEFKICSANREMIQKADEVHVYWDGRSTGTIFDLGMVFALNKKIIVEHLGEKSFINFVKQWEKNQK